jgi:hypothetical protein
MNSIIHSIENFFNNNKIQFNKLESGKTYNFEVKVPEGNWVCRLVLRERTGISIYSILPIIVDANKLSELAFYLMKLNNEIVIGNFELNNETNEIKFKTYIDAELNSINERLIERNVLINNATMQKYIKTIMQKSRRQKSVMFHFW